jgi:hypothetical protein
VALHNRVLWGAAAAATAAAAAATAAAAAAAVCGYEPTTVCTGAARGNGYRPRSEGDVP